MKDGLLFIWMILSMMLLIRLDVDGLDAEAMMNDERFTISTFIQMTEKVHKATNYCMSFIMQYAVYSTQYTPY